MCPGEDDALCVGACSADAVATEEFGAGVVGCAGSVAWEDRADLCGPGSVPATAEDWVAARGDSEPTYHYWTDDDLAWESTDRTMTCSTDILGNEPHTETCPAGPMRVCAGSSPDGTFDVADPLGNSCTWVGCGWLTNEPNEFFGGCSAVAGSDAGGLAGTLCTSAE